MAVLVSPVLVGRREELGVLADAFARARGGEPSIVLVGGEAGIGKTRLVEEASARAQDAGIRLLSGSCVELGGEGLPLAPLVDVLRALARSTPPEELDALLGPARGDLARLLPELDPGAPPAPARAGSHASRLFELVLGLLDRLAAERPLAVVLEDLHWADRSTVDLFGFLVHALRATPVAVVGTYRSDELHRRHPLRPLLASLERVRVVRRIELARFTRGEVADQLAAILGAAADPALVDRVHRRSEGNAFLVEEMLGIVQAGGDIDRLPPSLRDVLLARAEQMPERVQRVLRVAAAAGSTVPEGLLGAVAGLPEPDLIDALREAVEHHLLVADEPGYGFRHPLVRHAVYDDMLPGERVGLHTAYGDAVEHDPSLAGDEASAAAALAHHWYAAHDLPRALTAAVQAARHASAGYAPADAERHLERALELWPQVLDAAERTGLDRLGLTELAIDAALAAGDESRALALIDEALANVDRERQSTRVALLLEHRAQALRWMGRSGGVAELEEAVRLLPAEPATAELASVLASLANTRLMRGENHAAREIGERALTAARAAGDRRQETSALTTLGSVRAYDGDEDGGVEALAEAARIAQEDGNHDGQLRALINLSDVFELVGRHEEAAATAAEGLDVARRVGLRGRHAAVLTHNVIEPLVRLGRWEEAERFAARSEELGPLGTRAPADLRGIVAIATGRYDEAARLLEAQHRERTDEPEFQEASALALLELHLRVARGEIAEARKTTARALGREQTGLTARGGLQLAWLGMRVEADAATLARDRRTPEEAQLGLVPELEAFAAGLPILTRAARGYAALVKAERARAAGEPAAGAWSEAVTAWREAVDVHTLAYALLRLGEAHVQLGDRAAAAGAVREALEIAEGLGAEPLAAEASNLARRARLELEPDRPRSSGGAELPFGLTGREHEVLRLLAAGRTNREIGETLYMSPKTASVHVSRILAKLGVPGRVEAATIAHRHGLAEEER